MAESIRVNHVYDRAHTLAESGFHQTPAEIVAVLVEEGYPEATELLNSENIRADLSRTCELATDELPRQAAPHNQYSEQAIYF
jgi:hypothetical protein